VGISQLRSLFSLGALAPNPRISAERIKSVADILMEKQQKQRGRGRGRPFEKGQSGNPAGRPPGMGKRATQAMQSLLDGEAQALTRKAVELALDGNTMALRMCLDRIGPPRRERAVPIKLPPVRDAADLAGTMTAIIAAAGEGAISPDEGGRLARLVEIFLRAVETRLRTSLATIGELPSNPVLLSTVGLLEYGRLTRRGWRH
jgi:hypothetical protein